MRVPERPSGIRQVSTMTVDTHTIIAIINNSTAVLSISYLPAAVMLPAYSRNYVAVGRAVSLYARHVYKLISISSTECTIITVRAMDFAML